MALFGKAPVYHRPAGRRAGLFRGMRAFRHKTRHWYFVLFMPLIALLQWGAGVYWLLMR